MNANGTEATSTQYKNVAFIPVRGGSTSIPFKNIKPLAGKPLVYWTASAAAACPHIDEVFVSTDSDLIRSTVEELNIPKVTVIGRSAETASNTASSESALLEFANNYTFELVAFVQATSPLLTADDLSRGFDLIAQDDCDSVLSVVEDKHFYWNVEATGCAKPLNYDVFNRPRRQNFDGCYQENGAFYITSRANLLASQNRVSGNIKILPMAERTLFEIDEPSDWPIIEGLLKQQLEEQEIAAIQAIDATEIKLFLTDCDGCLTDAGMYYSEAGDELKKFNTRDGMAFKLLKNAGIKTGIITGENSKAAQARAEKLKLDYLELGCENKLAAIQRICKQEGISLRNVAYVGDDINDIGVLNAVGYSFCPADAQPEAKQAAQYTTKTPGGQGVIREITRMIF